MQEFSSIGKRPANATVREGERPIECPNCRYVREEADLIVPAWQCPQCGVAYAKFKAAISKIVRVRLSSGREIEFSRVKLYDLNMVRRLEALRQQAVRNFGPVSTGLGFWGSVEWVAAGSLLTGLVERDIANNRAKEGLSQLAEVANLGKWLRDNFTWMRVAEIENMKYPDIGLWKAVVVEKKGRRELVHIASEYVFVEVDGKETAVFWDKIEQYELTENV